MISIKIGHSLDPSLLKIYRFFCKRDINPNIITLLGVAFGFIAAILIAPGYLLWGGIAIIIAGFFDLLDGALARSSGHVSRFGGFFDSVLDRYTDLVILFGIFIYFIRSGNILYSIITFIASIGTAIIPYAKARAEAVSFSCNAGIMERPERIIIILIGLFFNLLSYAVIILAVFTHLTVIQRILSVRSQSKVEK